MLRSTSGQRYPVIHPTRQEGWIKQLPIEVKNLKTELVAEKAERKRLQERVDKLEKESERDLNTPKSSSFADLFKNDKKNTTAMRAIVRNVRNVRNELKKQVEDQKERNCERTP